MPTTTERLVHEVVRPHGDLILRIGSLLNTPPLSILVHSKAMKAGSPVFRAMLGGSFLEGNINPNPKNPPVLELPEDKGIYMLTLCQLLHFRSKGSIDATLADLVEVGVVVDKYLCQGHRTCRLWLLEQLEDRGSSIRGNPQLIAQAITAAWLFGDPEVFFFYTRRLMLAIRWKTDEVPFKDALGDVLPEDLTLKCKLMASLNASRLGSCYTALLEKLVGVQAVNHKLNATQRSGPPPPSNQSLHSGHSTQVGNAPSRPSAAPIRYMKPLKVQKVKICPGTAHRISVLMGVAQHLGIGDWERRPLENARPVVHLVTCLKEQITAGERSVTRCNEKKGCTRCDSDWLGVVSEEVQKFYRHSPGFCLMCWKVEDPLVREERIHASGRDCPEHKLDRSRVKRLQGEGSPMDFLVKLLEEWKF